MLARHLLIEVAGFVGGYTATGGLLILPLAVLARLIGFVGMFLVIRDGLRTLQQVAPLPESARARRQDFIAALLASVLPFFAVYAAQKELRGDIVEYAQRALDVRVGEIFAAVAEDGESAASDETVLNLTFNVWTILIIVLAFAGRWAWKRWADRLPRVLALVALYLEVVWVFFSLLLLSEAVDTSVNWIETRAATAWITDLRAWISDGFAGVDWIIQAFEAIFADAGRVIIEPIAWLLVAGIVYGQAITAERLRAENRLLARARAGAGRVPAAIRVRVAALTSDLTSRFQSAGDALLLMVKSGPLIIASYLLLYAVVKALEPVLALGLVQLLGPHQGIFWAAIAVVLGMIPLLVVEPIRVSLIAATYDTTLRELEPQDASDQGSMENRANTGAVPYGTTSTQYGPEASSGTMNGTSIS
jgi:hypothetical protein